MSLKTMNRVELDQRIKTLAQKERDLLHEILLTINEIDLRRAYLELGFGSLFEYLVQGVGYSEGSAQRRIDAARVIREIPAVAEKIQYGEIKLNQISLIQKASREIFKNQSVKVTAEQKLQVIESLCGKNHSESQHQVAAFFDLPVLQSSQQKVQADESVRVELTLSKEAFSKIKRAQELLSHALPDQELSGFFEFLSEKVIKQKTGQSPKKISKVIDKEKKWGTASSGSDLDVDISTATVAGELNNKRPSLLDTKLVKSHQPCCQYIDQKSGQRCKSTWKLQIDHKQSRWAGGDHGIGNLQHLCASHNRLKYRNEAGIRYLSSAI